jgi:hypothetical protein
MKKNVLKFASFALGLCVATALTSCHSGEEQEETTVVNNVTQLEARTLFVHTNVSATVQGVGFNFSKTGENVEITNAPASGQFKVSADGRQTKTISFNFQDGAVLYFDIELVSAGKGVPQATAEAAPAGTVNNTDGSDNAEQTGVDASIDFNGATNTNASATGDYSITVFTPDATNTSVDGIKKNDKITEAPLAIECKPDGAVFSSPIKVSLNIPGSAGYVVNVKNGTDVVVPAQDGDKLTADIPHFSVWDVLLVITCGDLTTTTKEYEAVAAASDGKATLKVDYGYEADEQTKNSLIAKKLLKKMFGRENTEQVSKTVAWEKVDGTATVKASQVVKTYKFNSGEKNLEITVYGKVTTSVSIETTTPEEVKTHGGGSN